MEFTFLLPDSRPSRPSADPSPKSRRNNVSRSPDRRADRSVFDRLGDNRSFRTSKERIDFSSRPPRLSKREKKEKHFSRSPGPRSSRELNRQTGASSSSSSFAHPSGPSTSRSIEKRKKSRPESMKENTIAYLRHLVQKNQPITLDVLNNLVNRIA